MNCFKDYKSASKKCAEMNKEFEAGKELYFIYGVRKENSSAPTMSMDGFEIMTRQEFKDKFEA